MKWYERVESGVGIPAGLRRSLGFRGRAAGGASPPGLGGAALREPKSRAGDVGRARPGGRAAGCWGGSYLWLRRGGHHSPFLFGGSRFPPLGFQGQKEKAEAVAAGGRMVPRGWAQPPQGPRERRPRIPRPVRETPPGLGRHIPRRTPPREHALEAKPRSLLLPVGAVSPPQSLPVLPGLSDSHRQLPPRPQSAWACAPPTPLTRPRPARLASPQPSRRARTYLPRPLLPSPGQPRPAPPPHVTPLGRALARARPFFPPPSEWPRLPSPSSLYGSAENSV